MKPVDTHVRGRSVVRLESANWVWCASHPILFFVLLNSFYLSKVSPAKSVWKKNEFLRLERGRKVVRGGWELLAASSGIVTQ